VADRFGPLPPAVIRLVEVAELRLSAEAAGITSLSREEGQLVVRFGSGLSRGEAMRLIAGAPLPGVRPGDMTFAASQVRIRIPRDAARAWVLTQAIVTRVAAARGPDGADQASPAASSPPRNR
jgi:transcription-repair coupling factor (superfamily II helicase)